MSEIILPRGHQKDGSVVDMYGNRLTREERLDIVTQVAWLPATLMKSDIIKAVQANAITIIDGETGSGKTTQIGKMLFNPKKQITITQPRVLSAMSNSNRVSQEFLAETGNPYFSLGHGVGYRTGRGVSSSRISPLSFNTDGLELMRMAYSGCIPDILVLDEVHNFAIPTEILAMLTRNKKNIKIIIMSATLDSWVFQDYYKGVSSDIPVIKIPGRTYPVEKQFDSTEKYLDIITREYNKGKNILFFVPGKKEIDDNIALLRATFGEDVEIFPLHADLPKEEQQKLLTKSTSKKPRIIVCTNVAEESITIPYIDVVVDLGTHKVAHYNEQGIQELRLENTAQANVRQRLGRAGRTHDGIYFRTNEALFDDLPDYPKSPMEREMLDRYILILLANKIDITLRYDEATRDRNRLFFHDFNKDLLDISYERLALVGAINKSKNITPLGRDLLALPLDIYHARMLREGVKRKCVEDMIYTTAILEKKGFVSKSGTWKEIKMSGGKESDVFGYADLFKLCTATTLPKSKLDQLISLGIDKDKLNDFVIRKWEYRLDEIVDLEPIGVKNKKVKEIYDLVLDLKKRLTDSNIDITSSSNMSDKKICLAAGSMHYVYTYDPETNLFQSKNPGSKAGVFYGKAGNVSLVEPTADRLYLGQPFIIGASEYTDDLNLLTFITRVDALHIKEAKLSTEAMKKDSYEMVFGDENGQDGDILNGASILERFSKTESSNFFWTQEDPRMYYLRYRLPDIIIAHDPRIGEYLKDKSDEQIFAFKELMVRFLLVDEAYDILSKSIAEIEWRFRHDSNIFDRFLDSKDPFIQAFRKGETVSKFTTFTESTAEDRDIFELQSESAKLLGSMKHTLKVIDTDTLKVNITRKYFAKTNTELLSNVYQILGKMDPLQVKKGMTQLKGVERDTKSLKKILKNKNEICNIIHVIESLLNGEKNLDTSPLFAYKFGEDVSTKYIDKYYNALRLAQSRDKRKQQRGARHLEGVILDQRTQIQKLDKEIELLTEATDITKIPEAVVIQKSIKTFYEGFFDVEYAAQIISNEILDITREIFRDQVTENKWIEKILANFLYSKDFTRTQDYGRAFQFVLEHNKLVLSLNMLGDEVRKMDNVREIQWKFDDIQETVEAFRENKRLMNSLDGAIV